MPLHTSFYHLPELNYFKYYLFLFVCFPEYISSAKGLENSALHANISLLMCCERLTPAWLQVYA